MSVGERLLVAHSVAVFSEARMTTRVVARMDESLAALRERVLNESYEAQCLARSADELRDRDRENP